MATAKTGAPRRSRRACLIILFSSASIISVEGKSSHYHGVHPRASHIVTAIQRVHVRHRQRPTMTELNLLRGGSVGRSSKTEVTSKSLTAASASAEQASQPSLVPLLASTLLLMISLSIVSLSPTPILIDQFGPSRATHILSTIAAVAAASEIILSPILGALLDSMGRKPALLASISSVAIMHAVVSTNTNALPVCIARYLCYVALPQFFVASQAVAGDVLASTPDKMGSLLGIQSALISGGFIGGVKIAALLGERGPRVAYGASSILAVASGMILAFGQRETLDETHKVPFDVKETKRKVIQAPVAAGTLLVGRGRKIGLLALLFSLQSMPTFIGDVFQVFCRDVWGLGQSAVGDVIAVFGLSGIIASVVGSILVGKVGVQNFTSIAILSSSFFPIAAIHSYKASLVALALGFLGSCQTIGVVAELTAQVSVSGARQGEIAGERGALLAITKMVAPLMYGGLYIVGSSLGFPQLVFAFNIVLTLICFVLSRQDVWR